jgi:hypothetical protein
MRGLARSGTCSYRGCLRFTQSRVLTSSGALTSEGLLQTQGRGQNARPRAHHLANRDPHQAPCRSSAPPTHRLHRLAEPTAPGAPLTALAATPNITLVGADDIASCSRSPRRCPRQLRACRGRAVRFAGGDTSSGELRVRPTYTVTCPGAPGSGSNSDAERDQRWREPRAG